jgi:hypothetical protein
MTYSESAKGKTISKERALLELKRHGMESSVSVFFKDMGDKEEYKAQAVLVWLGY